MLGGSIHIVKENAEALLVASKEIALEVNFDKTKYMVMSRDQNAGRSHNIKIDNSFFERVEEFRYLGTTLMNQNSNQEEIKSRLKSENACYHSVQNLLSSSLLLKKFKDQDVQNYNSFVCMGVKFCHSHGGRNVGLRLFENRVLSIFGPKRDEVTGEWRKLHH